MLTALQLLEVMAVTGATLADLRSQAMEKYPQVLVNVEVDDPGKVSACPEVWEAVAAAEEEMADNGRVLVRPSGTEPLVRVMVECRNSKSASRYAQHLAGVVASALGH